MNGEVKTVLDIIESVGVIGVLVLISFAFYSGKLISSKVNQEIIDVYKTEAEKLGNGMTDKMDEVCTSQKEVAIAVQQLGPKLDNIYAAITRGQAQGGD